MTDPERAATAPTSPAAAGARAAGPLRWLWRALAGALGLSLALVLSGLLLIGVALAVAYPNLPDIGGLTDYRPKLPLRVLSSDGVLLGEFGEERRIYTPIAQIPKVMQEAVLLSLIHI